LEIKCGGVMLRVGINGFGRIGRAIFRVNMEKKMFDVVAINDINPSTENLAYLLKYDSIYGRLSNQIGTEDNKILIDENEPIRIYNYESISNVPWEEHGVEIVIDASGVYENLILAREIKKRGVKNCVVTHSSDDVDSTVILGVNENDLDCKKSFLISSSICDANAFSPAMNVLNEAFGIEHGFLTTLHPWLGYQNLLDGPSRSFAYPGTIHKYFALGRASTEAIIPKTTSCIAASSKVLDFLSNKFQCLSFRVPTPIISTADISVKLHKSTTKEEIIGIFLEEEKNQKFNIFYNNFEPLISTDFTGFDCSVVIDHRWTELNQFDYVKLILWYDNEWGYSSRVVDLVGYIGNSRT